MPGFPSSDLRLKQGQKLITSPVLLVAFLKINISGMEKALGLYFISYKCVWGGGAERQTDRQTGGWGQAKILHKSLAVCVWILLSCLVKCKAWTRSLRGPPGCGVHIQHADSLAHPKKPCTETAAVESGSWHLTEAQESLKPWVSHLVHSSTPLLGMCSGRR